MDQDVNRHAMLRGLTLGAIITVRYILSTFQSTVFVAWGFDILIIYYVYRCAVDCRENVLEGIVSYGGAWWYVVKLFLYSSMVAGVFKYVYLKFVRPNFLTEMLGLMKETSKQIKLEGSVMNESMASLQQLLTPENIALYSILGDVILGVFLGLIVAAIVKRDETWRHTNEE